MKSKSQKIKDIATQLANEFDNKLQLTVLPNGSVAYKNYIVKEIKNKNWAVYEKDSKQFIGQFFLKSCALMAAKAHDKVNIVRFNEVKQLDTKYWANHSDSMIFKHNIKKAKDIDRYLILLTKLERSTTLRDYYKDKISRMFSWSFV